MKRPPQAPCGGFTSSEDLIATIAAECDTCLLSFSTGKDACAAYLAIKPHFRRVVPFYCYLVPNLEFVEESLAYYEETLFGGEHILRLPHPSLYRMLNNLTFQPPERCAVIEAARLPMFEYADVYRIIREDLSLPPESWVAVGVRAVDSPYRWRAIQQHGPLNRGQRTFYPVYDWRLDRLEKELRASGLALPVDYRLWGRSFDGIDARFLKGMKEHLPADYQRVLDWFPLAELELERAAAREAYHARS